MLKRRLHLLIAPLVCAGLIFAVGAGIAAATCGGGEGSGLTVSPSLWVFTSKGQNKTFIVKNTGGSLIGDLEVTVLGSDFKRTGTNCGKDLNGGASCEVQIEALGTGPNGEMIAKSWEKFASGFAEFHY